MAFQLAEWFVSIGEKGTSQVLRKLDTVKSKLTSLPKKWTLELGGGLKGALGAAGISFSLLKIAEAGAKAEASLARFNTMFRNTAQNGKAAGFTREEMDLIAQVIGRRSMFGAGAVRDAARELLDVGRVSGDQFIRALEVSADVAHMSGGTMVDAAKQIGLALADPSKAERLLRGAGEVLDANERKVLAASKKGGAEFAKAQALVLEKFGQDSKGMSETMRGTLMGAWMQFQNELRRIGKQFGAELIGGFRDIARVGVFIVANFKDVMNLVGQTLANYFVRPIMYLGDLLKWFVAKLESFPMFGGKGDPGAAPTFSFFSPEQQALITKLGQAWAKMFGTQLEIDGDLNALRGRPGFQPGPTRGAAKIEILNLDESWKKLQDALDGGSDAQERAVGELEQLNAKIDRGIRVSNLPAVAWA